MHRCVLFVLVATCLLGLLTLSGSPEVHAQRDEQCFAETGFCVAGRIRQFWQQNGGLAVFGFPIAPEQDEQIEGRTVRAQWFERNRLELHPENAPPYDVLLGRLGVARLAEQQRAWEGLPRGQAQQGCRFFEASGHNLCPPFLEYWQGRGLQLDGRSGVSEAESLALFGLPVSEPQRERARDGNFYTVQWFERARLELHPENAPPYNLLLGLLGREAIARSPLGYDFGPFASEPLIDLAAQSQPRLARVGNILWSELEPERGQYRWELLAPLEQRVAAVRARGIEPVLIVQWSPEWARLYPQSLCGPIRPDAYGDFANFMRALAARYRNGPAAIRYWEIWNEPDFFRDHVPLKGGFGCWAEPGLPFSGGDKFGELLKAVYGPIKEGNPGARVIAGSLSHIFAGAQYNDFLEGMLAASGGSFDLLGFHAFDDWQLSNLLVRKVAYARERLARYGLADKPLIATELGTPCVNDATCGPERRIRQANQVARLNAEAISLGLEGVLWYTLADLPVPGQMQLITIAEGGPQLHPALFALRNSARLLRDAIPTGAGPRELPRNELATVQVLAFLKPTSTLYVLWVQQTGEPVPYQLAVPAGSQARCYEQLHNDQPIVSDCGDSDGNGLIDRAVAEAPQYVEVVNQ